MAVKALLTHLNNQKWRKQFRENSKCQTQTAVLLYFLLEWFPFSNGGSILSANLLAHCMPKSSQYHLMLSDN